MWKPCVSLCETAHGGLRRAVCYRPTMRRTVVLALLSALACGDGGGAGLDRPGPYDEATDFPTDGCDPAAAYDPAELAGIWHFDLAFDSGYRTAAALRIDVGDGGPTALLLGRPAAVRATGPVLIRRVDPGASGDRVRAALICGAGDGETRVGHFATCEGEDCFLATATYYPLRPLAEPVAAGVRLRGAIGEDAGWPEGTLTANVRHRGTFAYLARFGDGLRIIDLTDPDRPVERGHQPVLAPGQDYWNDVKLVDGPGGVPYALMASNVLGVVVVDVSDPAAPRAVTSFPPAPASVHTLALDGSRAYLADQATGGLTVYDVADPAAPVRLGDFIDPRGAFVHDLHVVGGKVYLNYWNLGMVIVDASGLPGRGIAELARFDAYERRTSHSAWAATVAGGRRIVIHGDEDFDAHVRILDDDPDGVAFLDVLAEYQTRPEVSVHNVMAAGDLALVTYYQDGLRLLDLSDPAAPVEVGHFRTWPGPQVGYGRSLYEGAIGVDYDDARDLILLADTHRGLLVLDPSEIRTTRSRRPGP
jgi:hypothetical protein